jgi:soluble lytic murein transglycosylase-like protein
MTTEEIKSLVVDYANGCGINPNLALAQISKESGFNPNITGTSGERGLAQIMPGTWQRFAPQGIGFDQAYDPDYNLSTWCAYMAYLSGLFDGDMYKVLVAYNGGEGHLLDPGRYGAPSSAAQNYALSILSASGDWPAGNPPPDSSSTDWSMVALVGGAVAAMLLVFRR